MPPSPVPSPTSSAAAQAKSPSAPLRRYPIGAEVRPDGGVHFRVWAPESPSVAVELLDGGNSGDRVPLAAEPGGYFSGQVTQARAGSRYRFVLESGSFPDPASAFQPDGPNGPSEVVDTARFRWTDSAWQGRDVHERVIYELHIGTFTREGTWAAAMRELPALRDVGVTVLEVMPIADFCGEFGWGYDGVNLFAPTRLYGRPDDVSAFVNRAHELGLMVILDVVYNHLGPDGNHLPRFSRDYLSRTRKSEWGDSINFDGPSCGPVREFFVTNARYWIETYHFDGLRLDATQQIFDESNPHIIAEIASACRAAAGERRLLLVGENEPQLPQAVRPRENRGWGLDALWNDDFHHTATVAATGRAEAYYSDHRGTPQEFVSACKHGFLFQGQWYGWQQKRRGGPAFDLTADRWVIFLQNHDQVANSLTGQRLHELAAPGVVRALTAVLLLAPQTPLLFQGQEFAASAPFLYFADHTPDLRQAVSAGRRKFLEQFPSIARREVSGLLPDPGDRATFERCKLDAAERERHAPTLHLHTDLLRLRREDPVLRHPGWIDGAVLGADAWVLRFFGSDGDDRLLLVNLGTELRYQPAPEPLLSPPTAGSWHVRWESESPRYGGCGAPPIETRDGWVLPGHAAVLLEPGPYRDLPHATLHAHD